MTERHATLDTGSVQSTFEAEVHRLRAAYQQQRDTTNLVPPTGRPILDQDVHIINGVAYHTYWYELDRADKEFQVIRLADIPGTLSGSILRLKASLPALEPNLDWEIIGDAIRQIATAPHLPELEDDSEEVGAVTNTLPTVEVTSDSHFTKACKYRSEVRNLLACQGGECPGTPKSPHVIQLLGRTADGLLVFPKLRPRYILARVQPVSTYKRWIMQAIQGMQCLHALGIVHRDLRIDNILFSDGGRNLVICDLESRWSNRLAPEVSKLPVLEGAGWSEKSDIYDLGMMIKGIVYGNTPITNLVEWEVPFPLDGIVAACIRPRPEERPSLVAILDLVKGIRVEAEDALCT